MPARLPTEDYPTLNPAAEDAVEAACCRQLESLQDRLLEGRLKSFEEAREVIEEWVVDECLILGLDSHERLSLVEDFGDEYGLELGEVELATIRGRVDTLAATIVGYLGEARAQEVLTDVEDLLSRYEIPLHDLLSGNPFGTLRHYGERAEGVWRVYEYRNLEDEGIHLDLFEMNVGAVTFAIRRWLPRGTLSPAEESWDAT